MACLSGSLRAADAPVMTADVVVVAATPGGIAAAVAAARSGSRVILFEEKAHVGGILAGGLSNIDNNNEAVIGGLYKEFRRLIVGHYAKTYGANSAQVKACREGRDFEPRVAEALFNAMLAAEKNITVRLQHRLRGVHREGKRLRRIVMVDLADRKAVLEVEAGVFIDATYEGDLAAMAGVPFRVGRESSGEYGEAIAGRIYSDVDTRKVLPGTTGEGDLGIQAYCFRFPLTNDPANRVPIVRPTGYNRDDYVYLLQDVKAGRIKALRDAIQMRPAPNNKVVVNNDHTHTAKGHPLQSLDLAEENWDWPTAGPETRARIFQRTWAYNEGILWLLQSDDEVPAAVRADVAQWGFCRDEFPDHNHRPWHIYVREGRRIFGEVTVSARNGDPDPATGRPVLRNDAIAIAEYGFDSHQVSKYDPAFPAVREGYVLAKHQPFQLPYGMVVPERVDGLLVPVACSASRIAYSSIRMEPVFMAVGEACGIAAHVALRGGVEVRAADLPAIQREIVRRGGVIKQLQSAIK